MLWISAFALLAVFWIGAFAFNYVRTDVPIVDDRALNPFRPLWHTRIPRWWTLMTLMPALVMFVYAVFKLG